MPTFKHPCPQCDTFIDRALQVCPACGFARPFDADAAARVRPRTVTQASAAPPAAPAAAAAPAPVPAASACTGCGAALPAGARFCTECGTLVVS